MEKRTGTGADQVFFYLQRGPLVVWKPLCVVGFLLDRHFSGAYIFIVGKGYPLAYTGFALKQEVEV